MLPGNGQSLLNMNLCFTQLLVIQANGCQCIKRMQLCVLLSILFRNKKRILHMLNCFFMPPKISFNFSQQIEIQSGH